MGWNFGGVVIDFDFQTVIEEHLEPELRQFRTGAETPEEARAKARIDAGTVAFQLLGVSAVAADAPVSFAEATSVEFDDYAAGTIGDKTILLGRPIGVEQCSADLVSAFRRMSGEHGSVLAFWLNDASGTRIFSVYRDGRRIRLRSSGPGVHDDEGPEISGEQEAGPSDREIAVLEGFVGAPLATLWDLPMERFIPA